MDNKMVVLVPYWIEDLLRRNKLPIAEVLNYTKMRELVSVDELSAFLSLQLTDFEILKGTLSEYLLISWMQTCPDDKRTELDSVVVPLANSKETIDRTISRFSLISSKEIAGTDEFCKVVDIDRKYVALILPEDFLVYLTQKEAKLQLLRQLLGVFYGYREVHEVSKTTLFRVYVHELNKTFVL